MVLCSLQNHGAIGFFIEKKSMVEPRLALAAGWSNYFFRSCSIQNGLSESDFICGIRQGWTPFSKENCLL